MYLRQQRSLLHDIPKFLENVTIDLSVTNAFLIPLLEKKSLIKLRIMTFQRQESIIILGQIKFQNTKLQQV